MPRPDSDRRSKWPVILVTSTLVLVPVLYVLSIGPANSLYVSGKVSREATERVYAPLISAARYSRIVLDVLGPYCEYFHPYRDHGISYVSIIGEHLLQPDEPPWDPYAEES
jgi:hypothetical protein